LPAHYGQRPIHLLHGHIGIVIDQGLAGFSLFGLDDDYPTGPPGTIDGGGTSILEDVNALNITGIYPGEIGADDAIDDDQGLCIGPKGREAPQADIIGAIGIPLGGHYVKPWDLTL